MRTERRAVTALVTHTVHVNDLFRDIETVHKNRHIGTVRTDFGTDAAELIAKETAFAFLFRCRLRFDQDSATVDDDVLVFRDENAIEVVREAFFRKNIDRRLLRVAHRGNDRRRTLAAVTDDIDSVDRGFHRIRDERAAPLVAGELPVVEERLIDPRARRSDDCVKFQRYHLARSETRPAARFIETAKILLFTDELFAIVTDRGKEFAPLDAFRHRLVELVLACRSVHFRTAIDDCHFGRSGHTLRKARAVHRDVPRADNGDFFPEIARTVFLDGQQEIERIQDFLAALGNR